MGTPSSHSNDAVQFNGEFQMWIHVRNVLCADKTSRQKVSDT